MKLTKIIIAISILITVQFSGIFAQTTPEIERLTADIAKNPDNYESYLERGLLYTWSGKFIGPNVAFENIGKTIDENRAKAKADAEMSLKIKSFSYKPYYRRGLLFKSLGQLTEAKKDFVKAAKMRNESNVVANIYKFDVSGSNIVSPVFDEAIPVLNVIIKGELLGKSGGYDSAAEAKAAGKQYNVSRVIMLNKELNKYFLYEAFIAENTFLNLTLAETPFSKVMNGKSPIPLTYESLKINPEYSVQPMPEDYDLDKYPVVWKLIDIVDKEGLILIKMRNMPVLRGSKGIRLMLDKELGLGNFDEAVKIYQWLEKININSNDLDVVKITRKTNLSKFYNASEKLKPFVEAEMVKWNYTEADKMAVRGTK